MGVVAPGEKKSLIKNVGLLTFGSSGNVCVILPTDVAEALKHLQMFFLNIRVIQDLFIGHEV